MLYLKKQYYVQHLKQLALENYKRTWLKVIRLNISKPIFSDVGAVKRLGIFTGKYITRTIISELTT